MDWLRRALRRLIFFFKRARFDREMEEEIQFHLEMSLQHNIDDGMPESQARYDALRSFGNRTLLKERSRDVWTFAALDGLAQDIRIAIRVLRKSRWYTAVALLALMLGIGANAAIFSVIDAVLIHSLPYTDADRLISLRAEKKGTEWYGGVSPADFVDWKAQSGNSQEVAAYSGGTVFLTNVEPPEELQIGRASDRFFDVAGVAPLFGRTFLPEDFEVSLGSPVVLSYRLWQRFGADRAIVGRTVTLNEIGSPVIGVMPPDFRLPDYAELWQPLPKGSSEMAMRGSRHFDVLARLKPGVTLQQAQSEMDAIASRLEQQYPDTNTGWSARALPIYEALVGDTRPSLLILLGAVALVLLIACVNVAGITMARGEARRREMAVRAALGASRFRIVRQVLTESLLLSVGGGLLGVFLAVQAVRGIVAFMPSDFRIPRLQEARVDASVLLFALAVSIGSAIIVGLLPALNASRSDPNASLKEGVRGSSGGLRLRRVGSLLVVCEVALTLALLAGATLLLQNFSRITGRDPGFNPEHLLAAHISARMPKYYDESRRREFYDRLLGRMETLPGVEAAALTSASPLVGALTVPFVVDGRAASPDDVSQATVSGISPGYFRTMGIGLQAGREFAENDTGQAPAVAMINETLARNSFPGEEPLGKRIRLTLLGKPVLAEVVGIARDARERGLVSRVRPAVYLPQLQFSWWETSFVLRTRIDPKYAVASLQRAISEVDPEQPVTWVRTMDDLRSESAAVPRLYSSLLGSFAAIALLLSVISIYGIVAYSVAQRVQEIGIRVALGANRRDILRAVMGQGGAAAVMGIAVGLPISLGLMRTMSHMLWVSASDPWTLIAASTLLLLAALCACYIPARRAAGTDPIAALRCE